MSGASSQSEAGMTLGVVCRDLTGWAGWCWAVCYVLGVVVVYCVSRHWEPARVHPPPFLFCIHLPCSTMHTAALHMTAVIGLGQQMSAAADNSTARMAIMCSSAPARQ